MLTEFRQDKILKLVNEKNSVTVQELTEVLQTSESTIRRDLASLDKDGLLHKVHGGATALQMYHTKDEAIDIRKTQHLEEKRRIASFAASLVGPNDFVYIDAGTTTEYMIDYLKEKSAVYVTNAISHAKKLVQNGFEAHLLGGRLKASTEAVVGNETIEELEKFNFTLGFMGANGVSLAHGYTTPEIDEAMVKRRAMKKCRSCYLLCDATKFNQISSITFADFGSAVILTTDLQVEEYRKCKNVMEVKEK